MGATIGNAAGWQDLAALAIVVLAALHLGRGFLARAKGASAGCGPGGGGCRGCPSNAGHPDGPGCAEPISIGGLPTTPPRGR